MRKIKIYLHTTIDGFVAGPGGEMDWIHVDDEMFDMAYSFTNNADTYLMGRKTYEMMESYWPTAGEQPNASKHDREHSAWYNKVPKVILSRTLKGKNFPNTEIISDNLKEKIIQLKQKPFDNAQDKRGNDIIIFGSPSAAHALMEHELIDSYGMFINTILLGKGIPMFSNINQIQKLERTASKVFSSGVTYLQFERK